MATNPASTQSTRTVITRIGLALFDAVAWILATLFAVGARYDFVLYPTERALVLTYALIAAGMQLALGLVTKLYRGRHPVGSLGEVLAIGVIVLVIGALLGIWYAIFGPVGYPRGITVLAPVVAVLVMTAGRFLARIVFNAMRTSGPAEDVLVYGAGAAGQNLARMLDNDMNSPYRILGFIDDDPAKKNLRIHGNRVLGTGDDLLRQLHRTGVRTLVIAMPSADRETMRRITAITDTEDISVLVMPTTREMVHGRSGADLHELDVADLLGRSQITTDLSSIAGYLGGRVVLVTGAGGSIGSEIARQVHRFGPSELVLLDRDESLLHAVQLSIYKQGLLDTPNMVLCDIRDRQALAKVFEAHHPDVIFHAAALKHLPMLEQYPLEGWKTNVLGTLNLLELSEQYGVERFVNVSTDKAADATSVLGKTKRIAEELTAHFADSTGHSYLSVRFGNVLGSRGSMLHTFTNQIAQGGPITVTHPDITRYFMTIPEACELVIQAGAIGGPGDVLVLEMGEPVRILDVANGLIARSGKDIEVVFTGLRPNEKLHEVLFSTDESATATSHPLINRVQVPALDPGEITGVDGADPEQMGGLTRQHVPAIEVGPAKEQPRA